jgi:hypothetical protein
MAKETTLRPRNVLEKLLILWQTKNHSKHTYEIAMIMAVAIYMNRHIFQEEINCASDILKTFLVNGGSDEVMDFIRMKLCDYQKDGNSWQEDMEAAKALILEDEELFGYADEIFHADDRLDPEERMFITSLKDALNNA